MRKVKEVLRLKYECRISEREVARSCQVSRSTVADYLRKASAAGINWTEATKLTEADIEKRLFPIRPVSRPLPRPLPEFDYIQQQLRRYRNVNLTLSQLWLEYKAKCPDGYQYSQFCDLYRRWRGKLDYCILPQEGPAWREGIHRLFRRTIHSRRING